MYCREHGKEHFMKCVMDLLCCWSVAQSCLTLGTPQTAACLAPLSLTISQSLLKRMSIESVMPCNHLSSAAHFASCPQSLPAWGSFSSKLALSIRWPLFLLSRGAGHHSFISAFQEPSGVLASNERCLVIHVL